MSPRLLSTSISNSPSSVCSLTGRRSSSFQQPFPASRSRRLQSSGVSQSPESFPVSAMPGKDDACSSEKEKNLELFLKVGLDERMAKNTIANNKFTANLTVVIHEAAVTDGCSRTVGNLLYTVPGSFVNIFKGWRKLERTHVQNPVKNSGPSLFHQTRDIRMLRLVHMRL